MKRLLFQGDSITDCGRNRDDFYGLGVGYPNLIKASLGCEFPEQYEFLNRGVSGNRIVDVYARIKSDIIHLQPDVLSLYVGVNDVWHEMTRQNGISTEKFAFLYDLLLTEVRAACPDTKFLLIAPFVLRGTATDAAEDPAYFETFLSEVREKAEVVCRMAEKWDAGLVLLQSAFDEAQKRAPATYWTVDGVHPTVCGHEIIKNLWLDSFEKL